MNQLLSNAASRLAAGALKTWTVVMNVCRTMLVDQTSPISLSSITCVVPVRNGARSTPASMTRPRGSEDRELR